MAKKDTQVAIAKAPPQPKGLATPTVADVESYPEKYTVSVKWTKPDTDKTKNNRTESQRFQWRGDEYRKSKKDKTKEGWFSTKLSDEKTSNISTSSKTLTIDRSKFYPFEWDKTKKNKKGETVTKHKKGKKLKNIEFYLRNVNSKSSTKADDVKWSNNKVWKHSTYTFELPKEPKITFEYDGTSVLAITVKSERALPHERWDCIVNGTRIDYGDTGADRTYQDPGGKNLIVNDTGEGLIDRSFKGTTTEKVFYHTFNNPQLPEGTRAEIKIVAEARGLRGNVGVTAGYTFRPPYQPGIDLITVKTGGTVVDGSMSVSEKQKYLSMGNGQVIIYFGYVGDVVDTSDEKTLLDKERTTFTLERRVVGERYDTPESVLMGTWKSVDSYVGSVSDRLKSRATAADNSSMGESVGDVISEFEDRMWGYRVWYRVKAQRQGMVSYSTATEATAFHIPAPSAKNDKSGFIDIRNGTDGKTIKTVVGWDDPNDSQEMYDKDVYRENGSWTTVIGYSEYSDANESNKPPEEVVIDWGETGVYNDKYAAIDITPESERIAWNETAECAIHDLTCGTPYYLWVRRHVEMDGMKESDKNSRWSPAPDGYFPFTPTDNPATVKVSTQAVFIPLESNSLTVSWTHDASSPQKEWYVYAVGLPTGYASKTARAGGYMSEAEANATYLLAESLPRIILKSGTTSVDSVQITYGELMSALSKPSCHLGGVEYPMVAGGYTMINGTRYDFGSLTTGATMFIGVGVSTGGQQKLSYANTVGAFTGCKAVIVASRPGCDVTAAATLTASPLQFRVFTDDGTANAIVKITSRGVSVNYPDGDMEQANGDYVWSTEISAAEWKMTQLGPTVIENFDSDDYKYGYYADVTVDEHADIWQNGIYDIRAHAVSGYSKLLTSDEAVATVNVDYSRQPEMPGINSRCETRAAKDGNPYVEIYCAPPSNFDGFDHCNVYRVTPDGAYLIAEGVRFGTVVTDPYPPFSKVASLRYALTTVTTDGMTSTREIPYALRRHGLRFDWNGKYVELPYDIELSDAFSKDVDVRKHQDGTISAHWNPAVERTLSAGTKLIKKVELYEASQFELVREMAQYPGAVLVRAHNGICFAANVDVTGLTDNFDSLVSPVSIECTEIALPESYMATGIQPQDTDSMGTTT